MNSMLVYDPNETFPADSNDGGQRFVGEEPATMQELLNPLNSYEVADVVKHQFGPDTITPDYSYIKGDLTLKLIRPKWRIINVLLYFLT